MAELTETREHGNSALWAPSRRAATAGIILLVTLIAFENLGVSTAMPRLVADLHGGELYSWPFTMFLGASVIGTVLAGLLCDRSGPRLSLIVGPALFLAGLIVAGTSSGMLELLAGRAVQGLGAGVQVVSIYVLIGAVYAPAHRPAAFAALSAAWVVPGLIGPTVSGIVTEHVGWRWVFLGLVPLVGLGALLLLPVLRGLPAHTPPEERPRRGLVLAAILAAVGLCALTWAAQHPALPTGIMALAALAVLPFALRRLLPAGTVSTRSRLGLLVASRGLLAGSYAAVEAFLPLTLTAEHGYPAALAGLPLTFAAIGWFAASAWQSRRPAMSRRVLLRGGFVLLAVSLAVLAFALPHWGPSWLVWPLWVTASMGMGMAMPSISTLLLQLSPVADRGFNSSAVQLTDMLSCALLIGLGGVLVGALASTAAPGPAVLVLTLLMTAVAAFGALRLRPGSLPDSAEST